MSFLAPLFLLGALAIAGPIIFHLIRRTTREVTPFSSLMFLQPTPPRVTRKSRLENLWLLLLRCVVLALLAIGFARPFFHSAHSTPRAGDSGRRIVLLVDVSASMRRAQLWDGARAQADAWLRKTNPADEVAVCTFDRTVQTLLTFAEWKSMRVDERAAVAARRLAATSPGWGATHLDTALVRAAELLDEVAEEAVPQGEIVVISDLQEGSRLASLQGYEWARGLEVSLEPVRAKDEENAGLQWISETEEAGPTADNAPLRVRVATTTPAKREQFHLRWGDAANTAAAQALDIYVPAGQSRVVRPPPQPPDRALPLRLSGDDNEFDNTLFILPSERTQVPLLFLGQDLEDDPRGSLYYLLRGFPKTQRENVEISAHRSDAAVPAFQLQQAQLLVLGDGVPETALSSARQFAREGKIVLAPLTSVASGQTVAQLLEVPQMKVDEAQVRDYALFAQIDFQHPLFAPFADPRFSDFTKIHFWKYRRIDVAPLTGARTIARFDNGDPAIVQTPLGKGTVIIFASSWRPADSQLALSSKFVPLLHAVLEQSSNLPLRKAQYFIGDEVPLPPGTQPLTIHKPDGTELSGEPASVFRGTDQPGIYTVSPGALRFVVNLAPEESRTTPLTIERFASLGVPVRRLAQTSPVENAQREARAQAADLEARQKFWRWLIIGALGVLLLETLLAQKLSRPADGSITQPTAQT